MNVLQIFFLTIFLCFSESYKILVYYPLPVKSMTFLGQAAVKYLLEAGHEVTFISSYPVKYTHKNLRQIDTSHDLDNKWSQKEYDIGHILEKKIEDIDTYSFQQMTVDKAKEAFQNYNVTKFLENPNEQFDAVIVDLMETEVYAGLSALYDCPMIWLYSLGAHWKVVRLISEPPNPAYDADFLLPYVLPFNFIERATSLWARIEWHFYKTFFVGPVEKQMYEEIFGPLLAKRGKSLPNYQDIIFNTSFIFANEHNAVRLRPSTPQNFRYIGGFHIEDPVVPLPKDLQDILDNSPDGFIYFSMGTFFKSKGLPKSLVTALLNMFGELKHTVVWKFEADLQGVPKNVHILKWAPQQSILAHPKCKFFITHGGLLSSIESIHFGIPSIGIPVLFDQQLNVNKAVASGYALKVNLDYDMPQNLKSSINIMLKDGSYRHKIKELSKIYHDVPVKPGAEFVHWVNHVIRTRGAPHLRSPAHQVPFYQRCYLDLVGISLGVTGLIWMVLKRIFFKTKSRKEKNH